MECLNPLNLLAFDPLPQQAAITLERVSKTFLVNKKQITALDKVCCTIHPQRVTGLIGPDGAGKTTLMRLCAGLLTPDEGRLIALDIDVVREPLKVQASIGYMPQRFGLYEGSVRSGKHRFVC